MYKQHNTHCGSNYIWVLHSNSRHIQAGITKPSPSFAMNLAVMAGHRLIVGQSVSNKAHAALTATRLQYTSVRPNPPGALDRAGAGQEVVAGKGEVARSIDGPALKLRIAWEAKALFDVARDSLACDMAMLARYD